VHLLWAFLRDFPEVMHMRLFTRLRGGLLILALLATGCVDVTGRPLAAMSAALVCPVTPPNGATPAGELPADVYLGNGVLWTALWPDGVVHIDPQNIQSDGRLGMKWPWWRGVTGPLTITGRRLDAPAAALAAHIPEGYGASGFQATGLLFATTGCWEVTGQVGGATLTFVTLVVLDAAPTAAR
jgi:hypothetical protein